MTRTLVMFAAVSGLTMSYALAQAPPAPTLAPPSTVAPPSTAASPSSLPIVDTQVNDEWLASKLRGMTVVGSDDQKIGSVADILLDKTGKVRALIVGVGGLLGIGARQVAVEFTAFHEMSAANRRQRPAENGYDQGSAGRGRRIQAAPGVANNDRRRPERIASGWIARATTARVTSQRSDRRTKTGRHERRPVFVALPQHIVGTTRGPTVDPRIPRGCSYWPGSRGNSQLEFRSKRTREYDCFDFLPGIRVATHFPQDASLDSASDQSCRDELTVHLAQRIGARVDPDPSALHRLGTVTVPAPSSCA
jgi:PRC-barrel domain